MELRNIKEFCKEWKEELKHQAQDKKRSLGIVGHNSMPYVKGLVRDCEEIGISARVYDYDEDINFVDYVKLVYTAEKACDYIILQTPLPPSVVIEDLREYIDPMKDIDNVSGRATHTPNTPLGIIKYLDACGFNYEGANAVVLGRSETVGKPMAQMLLDKNCTVTICHSKTKHLHWHLDGADLIVCAVGKPGFLNCYSINDAVVIDVGINFVDGKVVGDCINIEGKSNVTPVPGGVGLLTRCALLAQMIA